MYSQYNILRRFGNKRRIIHYKRNIGGSMNKTDINKGLSTAEAEEKISKGLNNGDMDVKTKSVKRIFFDNIFTFFNLMNVVLAVLVLMVGDFRNTLFMGIIFANIAIGIFQEVRSKRVIDKLSIISAPKAHLLRDGEEKTLPVSNVVTDDIMLLSAGLQVCADAVVVEGECETNESLITGESDAISKKPGDELISGSFIVSGSAKAQVTRVGAESTSGKITSGSKYIKKRSSEMMSAIDKIIRIIAVCIVPFGGIMFVKSYFFLEETYAVSIVSTVAALIAMIPEGLVLLTSVALAISSIRLARKQTLCQDLYCVEALARVDVLCLDKTGTITEGTQEITEVVPLDGKFDHAKVLSAFGSAFKDANPTLAAIAEKFTEKTDRRLIKTIAFSSARKWSAAEFDGLGSIVVGAPSFVLGDRFSEISEKCERFTENGFRTLVLAHSDKHLGENALPEELTAKALIVMSDKIRASAPEVLNYFKEQGVALKVISGDDPKTVSSIALRAGLDDACDYIDMTKTNDDDIPQLVEKYSVFGRVRPSQKLAIIKALKACGHKVAMTGDGVNDVPALRESDCSVTVQSGSDAARAVSQIVLMDNDFAHIPMVVGEGRRCINNIQRSAALFLVKTIFAFLMTVTFFFLPYTYPFKPIQMTLVSALSIGAPSFLLALEPNRSIVKGGFLQNVMHKAVPGGLSAALGIGLVMGSRAIFGFSPESTSTIATLVLGAACFGSLWSVCLPFNRWRFIMFVVLLSAFCTFPLLIGWARELFYLTRLSFKELAVMGVIVAAVWGLRFLLGKAVNKFYVWKGNRSKNGILT